MRPPIPASAVTRRRHELDAPPHHRPRPCAPRHPHRQRHHRTGRARMGTARRGHPRRRRRPAHATTIAARLAAVRGPRSARRVDCSRPGPNPVSTPTSTPRRTPSPTSPERREVSRASMPSSRSAVPTGPSAADPRTTGPTGRVATPRGRPPLGERGVRARERARPEEPPRRRHRRRVRRGDRRDVRHPLPQRAGVLAPQDRDERPSRATSALIAHSVTAPPPLAAMRRRGIPGDGEHRLSSRTPWSAHGDRSPDCGRGRPRSSVYSVKMFCSDLGTGRVSGATEKLSPTACRASGGILADDEDPHVAHRSREGPRTMSPGQVAATIGDLVAEELPIAVMRSSTGARACAHSGSTRSASGRPSSVDPAQRGAVVLAFA